MEKAMYPSKVIRITQKHGEGTHSRNYAVDEAGADGGIGDIIAPFTGVIKRIYTRDANEVWLESLDKVEYANGTIDYMTILFAHDNDVSNLCEGQVIRQGQVFYQEGTKGKAYGNHLHFECGQGKFTGTGWHNNNGSWNINNRRLVTDCLWIDDTYKVVDTRGYNFRKIQKYFGYPVARNENAKQVEVLIDNLRARKTPNGDILGYITKGIYNVLKEVNQDNMTWFNVENDIWFANGEWCKVYNKVEPPVQVDEDKEKIKQLEERIQKQDKEIFELGATINVKDDELLKVKDELASHTEIYTALEDGDYIIKLYKNEKLYIKKD